MINSYDGLRRQTLVTQQSQAGSTVAVAKDVTARLFFSLVSGAQQLSSIPLSFQGLRVATVKTAILEHAGNKSHRSAPSMELTARGKAVKVDTSASRRRCIFSPKARKETL